MSTSEREHARGRAERRRRLQQRQTLVYGSLLLLLGLVLLISWLQWTGAMPSPFAREFTTEDSPRISEAVACPAEGTVMVAPGEITATVLNSTPTAGLAGDVAEELSGAGVVVDQVGNWGESVLASQGVIEVGPSGIAQGYSLQVILPGMPVMQVDREDAVATVIIGTQFTGIGDPAVLQPGTAVAIPAACLGATTEPGEAPFDGTPAPATEPAPTSQPSP